MTEIPAHYEAPPMAECLKTACSAYELQTKRWACILIGTSVKGFLMSHNWVIAIGINHYDNLKPLQYAKRDAEAVAAFCQEIGFDRVILFTEDSPPIPADHGPPLRSQPTFGSLERFLRVRFEEEFLKPEDNLWFFFAGHGKRFQGRDYLMPLDGDPGNVERTAISIRHISGRLRRSGAGNVVLMLDACRSEGDRDSGEGIGVERQQGIVTFFSCAPNQLSYEIEELQAGSFTHTLLQGLRIEGEGNCATVERLYQYLRYQVPQVNQQHGKPRQTPYTIAEPATKLHLILLPKQALLVDVTQLKNDAYQAEVKGKVGMAKELWVRVLAVSPADPEAVEAIQRLAMGGADQSSSPKRSEARSRPRSSES